MQVKFWGVISDRSDIIDERFSAVWLELSFVTRVFLTVLFNPLGKSHHDPIYQAIEMENMGVAKLKMLIPLVARKTFWNSGTVYRLDSKTSATL